MLIKLILHDAGNYGKKGCNKKHAAAVILIWYFGAFAEAMREFVWICATSRMPPLPAPSIPHFFAWRTDWGLGRWSFRPKGIMAEPPSCPPVVLRATRATGYRLVLLDIVYLFLYDYARADISIITAVNF